MTLQISRSEQKRRNKELEQLVNKLVALPAGIIKKTPCSQEVISSLLEAGALKGGARKRQIKYISKLLRDQPQDELFSFFSDHQGTGFEKKKQFHEIEHLRDAIINEALTERKRIRQNHEPWQEDWTSMIIEDILARYPSLDPLAVKRLAFLFSETRNPKYQREVFRVLRAAQEQLRFER